MPGICKSWASRSLLSLRRSLSPTSAHDCGVLSSIQVTSYNESYTINEKISPVPRIQFLLGLFLLADRLSKFFVLYFASNWATTQLNCFRFWFRQWLLGLGLMTLASLTVCATFLSIASIAYVRWQLFLVQIFVTCDFAWETVHYASKMIDIFFQNHFISEAIILNTIYCELQIVYSLCVIVNLPR